MGKSGLVSDIKFHLKRGWGLIKEVGLASWVAGGIVSALVLGLGWLHDHLPWSVLTLIAVAGFALASAGYYQWVLAHRVSRFDPKKSAELGRHLTGFYRDAMRAVGDWEVGHPYVEDRSAAPADQWMARGVWDKKRVAVLARYFPRAIAYVTTLHGLGITPPFNVRASASHNPDTLYLYLATIGELLEGGLIEEARAIADPPMPEGANLRKYPPAVDMLR